MDIGKVVSRQTGTSFQKGETLLFLKAENYPEAAECSKCFCAQIFSAFYEAQDVMLLVAIGWILVKWQGGKVERTYHIS